MAISQLEIQIETYRFLINQIQYVIVVRRVYAQIFNSYFMTVEFYAYLLHMIYSEDGNLNEWRFHILFTGLLKLVIDCTKDFALLFDRSSVPKGETSFGKSDCP